MRLLPPDLVSRLTRNRGVWTYPGWILLALGATGLIGRLVGIQVLVQPFLARPPLRLAGAISLVSLGVAALALQRERRRVAIVAAVLPIMLGYLALLQLAGLDLGLLPVESLNLPTEQPGLLTREILPLASGVGLLLAAIALIVCATRYRHERSGAFAVGLAGSVLVALNLAILLGQVFGLSPEVQFGRLAGASPQMALGLFIMGLALSSLAWNEVWAPPTYPAWVPPGVGLASLVAVLFVWRTLVQTQRDDHAALLRSVARAAGDRLQESVGRINLALWRIAGATDSRTVGAAQWNGFVRNVIRDEAGLSHVAWVSREGRTFLVPESPDSSLLRTQLTLQLAPFWDAPPRTLSDSARHFSLADSAGSVAIAIPECDLAQCDGFVVGVLHVNDMLHELFADSLDGFHRSVSWRGRTLSGNPPAQAHQPEFLDRSLVSFDDMTWELLVWPTPELQKRIQSGVPNLLLAFGLVMSALLALALQLGRTLQSNARAAEEVRLRLALGRSMDRAWSWDLSPSDRPAGVRESGNGQEVREGDWTELVHPEDRPRVLALLRTHLQGHTPAFEAQYRLRKSSGEWGWLVDRGHISERGPDGNPRKMLGVSGDVSERQRIEGERESSERRFRAIFDSAHHFQVLLDQEARVLEANGAALAALGAECSLAEIAGSPFAETWWRSDESTRGRIAAVMEEAKRGKLVTLEAEVEEDEGSHRIYDFSIKPIRDRSGQVIQLLAEGLDITTARRAEAKLREVETLSTMGRLAARVAHEINNPLAGIQNSFLLLKDAIPGTHPHYSYVGAMEREIGRIANVTRQLYETYRPETDGAARAGVRTLIGDAIALLTQVNRPSRVSIRSELDRLPTEVAIPESVLRQSVYNLVQNAVEASPPGGTVTVRAEAQNGTFELRVRDQGAGIPAEVRPVLFQPFVSTKGRNVPTSGMGIGLSLVHRSVQAVGGSIEILDPPDGGTEFVVRMPITGKSSHESSD